MNNSSLESSYACGLPEDFPPSLNIPPAINYIQAGIALVTGIIGLLLNIFILFIIIKYRSLRQRLMYIAIQISIVEIAYSLLVPPAIFISGIAREWLLGEAMCNILGIVNDGFAYFRFMMTFILTLDRFISIFAPFFYERNSKKILFGLHGLVYCTTFFRVLLPINGIMSCYVYVSTNKICTAFSGCSLGCYYFVFVSIILIIVVGALLPLSMYVILFIKAYRVKKATKKMVPAPSTPSEEMKSCTSQKGSVVYPELASAPSAFDDDLTDQKTKRQIRPSVTSSKSRHLSLSAENKKSLQVTITMFILLLSVIGCTSPAFVLYMVQFLSLHDQKTFFILIMLLGRTSFNSIPVVDAIAIMRDQQFRKSIKLCFRR
uniref:G-protein coupled receptors family 1 profile domain-containing protein n=1 Tax=Amphimedon queenslandica TaxID=400682 RepID=A0A1X7V807_AMPQE